MASSFLRLAQKFAGIRTAAPAAGPDALKAPVITRGRTYADIEPLQVFIDTLARDGAAAARYEATRLDPFYEAYSRYLRRTAAEHPDHIPPEKKERFEKLSTPGSLKRLFNDVAADTRSAILSEMTIMPAKIARARANLFPGTTGFNAQYDYNGHSFDFGFIQVFQTGFLGTRQRSVALPVLSVDDRVLEAMEPFGTEKLLHGLQEAGTWVNHDMLHHYTAHSITSNVAENRYTTGPPRGLPIERWLNQKTELVQPDAHSTANYETWSILSYAKMQEGEGYERITAIVDDYFDELGRIGAAWKERAAASGDPAKALAEAHRATDVMGTMMGFILMRAVPFDHPLMSRYFGHMERMDPAPEQAGHALLEMAEAHFETKKDKDTPLRDFIAQQAAIPRLDGDRRLPGAIGNYAQAGHPLLPPEGGTMSYRQIKEMQLALFDPRLAYLHSPAPGPDAQLARARRNSGPVSLDFVGAVADTVQFKV